MGTKYELLLRPSMTSLVIPSSAKRKCRVGSQKGRIDDRVLSNDLVHDTNSPSTILLVSRLPKSLRHSALIT